MQETCGALFPQSFAAVTDLRCQREQGHDDYHSGMSAAGSATWKDDEAGVEVASMSIG